MKEPVWLTKRFVLALHHQLLQDHGGQPGHDDALLEGAIARPKNVFGYQDKSDLATLAAAYAAGINASHVFIDGNKRTGFIAAAVFLDRNGLELTASEPDATQINLALASGDLSMEEYAAWLRDNT